MFQIVEEKPIVKLWTRDFVLLALANFFMAVGFYLLIPTLPVYVVNKLGAANSQVGYIIGFYTLSAIAIRPFTGYGLDTYGRKWIYLIGFGLFGLITGLYVFTYTFTILLALRFIHGFTWGITTTAGVTVAVDILPKERRGEGIGIFGLSMTLAMAIGPIVGLQIIGHDNYTALFLTSMTLMLIGFLLVTPVDYTKIDKFTEKKKLSFKTLFEKTSMPVALAQGLTTFTYGGIVTFITLYALELGVSGVGLFFLMMSVGIGLTRPFAGKLFDRRGPNMIIPIAYLFLIAGFLILALLKTPFWFYTAGFILGFGNGITWPTFQAMVNNMVMPDQRGIANSSFMTATDLGIGLGSVILGIVADKVSLSSTFLVCSVIIVVSFVYFLTFLIQYYDRHKIPV